MVFLEIYMEMRLGENDGRFGFWFFDMNRDLE